jgi:hypothetical protein
MRQPALFTIFNITRQNINKIELTIDKIKIRVIIILGLSSEFMWFGKTQGFFPNQINGKANLNHSQWMRRSLE